MLNFNVDWYKQIGLDECIDSYGWGYGLADNSTVFVSETDKAIVYVGIDTDGTWICEIEAEHEYMGEPCWDIVGQGWGDTKEKAMELAACDMVGTDVLREEDNCEDAVNGVAYEAYQAVYGETPMMAMELDKMDGMLFAAREYVKRNGHYYGIEWEEF